MTIKEKELEERNYHTGFFNEYEYRLNKVGQVIEFINPCVIVRNKNREMEELFYSHGKNYYIESKLGAIILDYLKTLLIDSLVSLEKAINFEKIVTLQGYIRISIKNYYMDAYNRELQKIKDFQIDETLKERLRNFITEERYREEIEFVKEELKELGYHKISNMLTDDTLNMIKIQKEKVNKKTILKKN